MILFPAKLIYPHYLETEECYVKDTNEPITYEFDRVRGIGCQYWWNQGVYDERRYEFVQQATIWREPDKWSYNA